jgi:hypothetical protein
VAEVVETLSKTLRVSTDVKYRFIEGVESARIFCSMFCSIDPSLSFALGNSKNSSELLNDFESIRMRGVEEIVLSALVREGGTLLLFAFKVDDDSSLIAGGVDNL